jgi:hypothetical protein
MALLNDVDHRFDVLVAAYAVTDAKNMAATASYRHKPDQTVAGDHIQTTRVRRKISSGLFVMKEPLLSKLALFNFKTAQSLHFLLRMMMTPPTNQWCKVGG